MRYSAAVLRQLLPPFFGDAENDLLTCIAAIPLNGQSQCGNAAETGKTLDQHDFGAVARCGNSGNDAGQAAAGDEDIHLRKDGRGTRCFLNIHESHLDIEISGIRINVIIAKQ